MREPIAPKFDSESSGPRTWITKKQSPLAKYTFSVWQTNADYIRKKNPTQHTKVRIDWEVMGKKYDDTKDYTKTKKMWWQTATNPAEPTHVKASAVVRWEAKVATEVPKLILVVGNFPADTLLPEHMRQNTPEHVVKKKSDTEKFYFDIPISVYDTEIIDY